MLFGYLGAIVTGPLLDRHPELDRTAACAGSAALARVLIWIAGFARFSSLIGWPVAAIIEAAGAMGRRPRAGGTVGHDRSSGLRFIAVPPGSPVHPSSPRT
ncbi:hypothetical protein [Allomesorhizobium alhagi]|uniref:hypothetical protein n=1 Tax=Allomesorhizobium alhagi TaxID=475067 RepID=UPI003B5894C2